MREVSPNTTISHYRIISKLGSGGMGEVYLAHDTKLDRKVALKILPSALAANQDRMHRFVQEAKCAAALNHPNIAHIYEIGEAENQESSQTVEDKPVHFIAMEFVDGHTLREEIHHHQRTPLLKLLQYLNQVAEGLAKAHAAGIIHRDLKPDNIMISRDGHAKILDFGLAKLVEGIERRLEPQELDSQVATVAMPQRTSPGAIMGTVGYMSPEQVKAKTLDQRSDIFSFGCVLYEAVTGRKPFAGDSVVDTLHKIIHEPAPAIADSNRNAPAELQRIIRRCLTKEPDKRYQTIRDTGNDLEEVIENLKAVSDIERSVLPSSAVSSSSGTADVPTAQNTHSFAQPVSSAEYVLTRISKHKLLAASVIVLLLAVIGSGYWYWSNRGTGGNQINSIAVLPFVNESGNPDIEYLSDGMTESLINSLSNLPTLSVKARNSVFRYKGANIDERRISQELSVDALLLGRVLQRGDNVTLYLSLVDPQTGASLWGEQYDRKMQDIAVLQKEIASDVSRKLRARLSNAEAKQLSRYYTDNSEAYQLYLKGRFFWNKRTPDAIGKAIEYFQQAIQKDPGFALAYTGLADSYVVPASRIEPHVAMPKAKTAALQALAIDETLAEAHTSLARVLQVYDWNWKDAEKEYRRAIELNPRYPVAHQWYGGYLERTGRVNEAISERQLALELDPLSTITSFELGANLLYARKYDQAIAQLQRSLELDPDFPAAHQFLPLAYIQKGMYEEALAKVREAPEGAALNITGMPGYVYAVSGHIAEAKKALEELKRLRKTEYIPAVSLAYICAGLGERDEALFWLEKGFEERAFQMQFLKLDPRFDKLRDDPRFKELVRKISFPS